MDFIGLFLNKEDSRPLYYQLYIALAAKIRAGQLPAESRLPGKRTAAAQLGVSVNTVDQAYQMLAAEGYVVARPRSGFVVARLQRHQVPPPPATAGAGGPPPQAAVQPGGAAWRYSFLTGDLDSRLFPHHTWSRLFREVLAGGENLFRRGEGAGDSALREAIADYLRAFRGVRCQAQQIVVGAGLEVLYGMLARLLCDECFALEEPGYFKMRHILRNMGVAARGIAVDAGGMRTDLLAQCQATAAYLTPSHQFPTGGVMPVSRRTQLLDWAADANRWLIEDDYDSEFRFDGRPLPSLQGLDEAGRVVYAGTFSRALAPGLRAAYLVLPHALLHRWQRQYADYACTVSRPEQQTLARLMAGGHFARSLNRVRAAYRRRRDLLIDSLQNTLSPPFTLENTHTGLYFVLRLPRAVAEKARAQGLGLRALSEYSTLPDVQRKTADALLLGYGGLSQEAIASAVNALAAVMGL